MKRIVCCLFACLSLVSAFAQSGNKDSWDSITCEYVNPVHGISWALPTQINWERANAFGPNICFKALDYESGIMLTISVKTDQKYGEDIWPYFSGMNSAEYKSDLIKGSKAAGVNVKSIDVVKSQIDGNHAIKTTTTIRKNDPAYGGLVDLISIQYSFTHNDKYYTVNFQSPEELKDEEYFDKLINLLFKGFKITK